MSRYRHAAAACRAPLSANPNLHDLVRYATLAPNSHNMQPWKFRLGPDGVRILPDKGRRLPAVDPDDHHLYVSLGCAAETLLIAANARGQCGEVSANADSGGHTVCISLGTGPASDVDLCDAVPERQTTRSEYDGRDLTAEECDLLERAARMAGVDILVVTDRAEMERIADCALEAARRQFADRAVGKELRDCIRFNGKEAVGSGDGLYLPCTGHATAPGWLGRLMFERQRTGDEEFDRQARELRSASAVIVFVADHEGPEDWMRVGRSFQRMALRATTHGIRHAYLNMPIEVTEVRDEFARMLGIEGKRPDLVIRVGRAPPMPMSLRRPVEQVLA